MSAATAAASGVMFDKDVARYLGISVRTICRLLKHPVEGEVDLNEARPVRVAGRRVWLRERVERLLRA